MESILKKIRIKIVDVIFKSKASHIGSIFSCLDIIFVLYKNFIHNKKNIFILSKGHAGLAYYAILNNFKKISNKNFDTYYSNGSYLTGHISHKVKGVIVSTGSLGQGLSVAIGYALQKKIDKKKERIFCLISDGECNEGSTWEAALFANHHKLNNLIVLIDYNKLQSLTSVKKTIKLEPLKSKWSSFGWKVLQTNGHNLKSLKASIFDALASKVRPVIIICNTTKGKGASLMENKVLWHYRTPNVDELKLIKKQIINY
jgi:transketolase